MNPWQGALTALDSLTANKLRSALTILGIVIGVAAVIALVSIGRGAQAQITSQIQSIGTNLVFVRPGSIQQGGVAAGAGSAATLTQEDAEALFSVPGVVGVAPEVNGAAQVTYLGQNTRTRVGGVTPDYLSVRNLSLADGEFVSQANVTARSSVVVLGSAVADTLFGGSGGVVGQAVRMNGQPCPKAAKPAPPSEAQELQRCGRRACQSKFCPRRSAISRPTSLKVLASRTSLASGKISLSSTAMWRS